MILVESRRIFQRFLGHVQDKSMRLGIELERLPWNGK